MKNYSYVLGFSKKEVDKNLIDTALNYAWKNTPSKNNFMNYNVHVLGPKNKDLRKSLYYKCLANQSDCNKEGFQNNLEEYDKYLDLVGLVPNFRNILSAPYIIIYTQRVSEVVNSVQQVNVDKGVVFEQTFDKGTKKYHNAHGIARFESGMFSANLSNKCLELGLDVSYIGCMPLEESKWSEPEWSFIKDKPIMIQLIGYGKLYKKDKIDPSTDLKPPFEKVVNIL